MNFKVNDIPNIEIENMEFPANASYNGNFSISFALTKKSQSDPKDVEVILAQNGLSKKWNMQELSEDRKFVVVFAGSQLKYGKNDYKINVDYFDGLGKKYDVDREFSIELADASPLQRVLLLFNNFESMSLETIVVMLVVGIVAFVAIVMWLFRKR